MQIQNEKRSTSAKRSKGNNGGNISDVSKKKRPEVLFFKLKDYCVKETPLKMNEEMIYLIHLWSFVLHVDFLK